MLSCLVTAVGGGTFPQVVKPLGSNICGGVDCPGTYSPSTKSPSMS
jgi:hypothetical protein